MATVVCLTDGRDIDVTGLTADAAIAHLRGLGVTLKDIRHTLHRATPIEHLCPACKLPMEKHSGYENIECLHSDGRGGTFRKRKDGTFYACMHCEHCEEATK